VKILVATTYVPFIRGGATMIASELVHALEERSHEVQLLTIPFLSVWTEMERQTLAIRMMKVEHLADRLICIRTPSYMLRHDNKVAWFIHHHRGAYDLWGTEYQDVANTEEGLRFRQYLFDSDNTALREVKALYTNSKRVSQRLKKYNDLDSTVLYPPLTRASNFYCEAFDNYIFYPSRMSGHKRQSLAIEAMQFVQNKEVKMVIAGSPDLPYQLAELEKLVETLNLSDRVTILGRWISEDEKIALFARARAGIYIPLDEDSYGYPTLEGFASEKPMITCTDSGGTLEIIEDGVNGYASGPEAESLGKIIDLLANNENLARELGQAGKKKMESMNISWDGVVEALTA
jgi:glycosyltransferase involved in cell wall biosynthesis